MNKPANSFQVHPFALGAGCDLILACDQHRQQAEDTSLGPVIAQRTITSGTALAPKHLPDHKACEMQFLVNDQCFIASGKARIWG